MITTLKIKNFQSHKRTLMEFHPGVNVIMGKSDSGKSAIRRAIQWVIHNRPSGDSFRSTWGGDTSVELTTNGNVITRIKHEKLNGYLLNTQTFSAIKTDIPEEVSKALNMTEINLQTQFDRPFLLDISAGEVAKHFNKIAHLNKIDSSREKVESVIRKINQDIAVKEALIVQYTSEQEKYEYLEKFEAEVEVLEKMESDRSQYQSTRSRIDPIITQVKDTEKNILEASQIITIENSVNDILSLIDRKETLEEELESLEVLMVSIKRQTRRIQEKKQLTSLLPDVEAINVLYASHNTESISKASLEALIEDIKDTIIKGKLKQVEVDTKELRFTSEFPNICPLCNSVINKKSHGH